MKKTRKLMVLFLVLALVLSLFAACTKQPDDSGTTPPADGKTRATTSGKADNSLTIALVDQVSTLDPHLYARQSENAVVTQMYDPLFMIDNDGEDDYILIESYTDNGDGTVDFVLKEGVKFQSGDPIKSEDVVYSLSRCEASTLCSTLFTLCSVEAADDTHFTFTFPAWEEGAGFSDLRSYFPYLSIVNKSYCETVIANPSDNLEFNHDGSGAYTFDSKNDNGDVVLKLTEGYHGTASIKTLNFKYITGSQEIAFESGDLDYALYGAANYALIKEYTNVNAREQNLDSIGFVICNATADSPLADLKVRQAVAYCLNREDIASIGTNDAGSPAYNLANPLINHFADVADHFGPDVDKANSLMSEAGYSASNKLKLNIICVSAYPDWVAACEVMKEELEKSYFEITIEQVADTARYFTYDFDLGMISLSLTLDFSSYSVLFDTASGLNLAGLENPDILAAFSAIKDEASAQNAMKLATESCAYIPLFYNTTFLAFDGDLKPGPFYNSITGFLYKDFSW